MALLSGLNVVQLGPGLAAAVCGRMFADVGAAVHCLDADESSPLAVHLNAGKHVAANAAIDSAALIVCQDWQVDEAIRRINPTAPQVTILSDVDGGPATDLTLIYASGIARLLTGQVNDLDEAPMRPVGEQSAFIGGLAAACAGMHAVLGAQTGAAIDVSLREALATLAMTELTRAGLTGRAGSRKRLTDGNGATVCILPARDGYVAISPREEKQWAAWLVAMGAPAWGQEPRFATKSDRVANWDALHALMGEWSRDHDKQWIADTAQAAHVPSFPLRDLAEHFSSPQLTHRGYWRTTETGRKMPGTPFGLTISPGRGPLTWSAPGPLPLSGIRVLDFSWVIAGPTATRYLAAMGAEVIKVEAPGRGDPGRASELHTVLGQAKKAIVLDLKKLEDIEAAITLAKTSDVLVENFATGVMDRLGLGADALREVNPNLIYVSASGMGRTGPEANAVAYGTLLQCYSGFAGLNHHPDTPPRVGFAWLDPMLGLMLAFATAGSLWSRRQTGDVARVDCSMIEAILWTLAEPLLAAQSDHPPTAMGNHSNDFMPHGAWRCSGNDAWISVVARNDVDWRVLCEEIPPLLPLADLNFADRVLREADIEEVLTDWFRPRDAKIEAETLRRAGVPAAALASSTDLVANAYLRQRGFWDAHGAGVVPGLPWRASFGRATGPAPGLGADSEAVLRSVRGQVRS